MPISMQANQIGITRREHFEWDPNQPRDESGKWSPEGSGADVKPGRETVGAKVASSVKEGDRLWVGHARSGAYLPTPADARRGRDNPTAETVQGVERTESRVNVRIVDEMVPLTPSSTVAVVKAPPSGAHAAQFEFDPDQPRDEHGRWSEAGGVDLGNLPGEHHESVRDAMSKLPKGDQERLREFGVKVVDRPGKREEYDPTSREVHVDSTKFRDESETTKFGSYATAGEVVRHESIHALDHANAYRADDRSWQFLSDSRMYHDIIPRGAQKEVYGGSSYAASHVFTAAYGAAHDLPNEVPAGYRAAKDAATGVTAEKYAAVEEVAAGLQHKPEGGTSALPRAFTYDPNQPRDYHGRWGEGDGKEGPEYVGRVVEQLYQGKEVEVPADQVTVVINELGRQANEAQAAGRDARPVDLCDMSVEGTNLFCGDAFGIPKQEMPQIEDANRGVFRDSLVQSGVGVSDERVPAEVMKATQGELNGTKVAGMMDEIQSGNTVHLSDERSIFVSKDNYILDGHHRWAAAVGVEYADGKADQDITLPVQRIDIPILDLLDRANSFVDERGIARKGLASTRHPFLDWFEWHYDPDQPRDEHGRWDGGAGADNPSGKDAIRMAPGTGSIVDRVGVMGGATIQPLTGHEPRTGYVIAREGTSTFVPEDDFFDREKGIDAVDSYLQEHADAFDEGAWMGLWFDGENSEVVLDVVDNPTTMTRDEAIAEGAARNQQSIWDVERGEVIDTGGTGGRDQAGVRLVSRETREEDLGDVRRRAPPVRREDPRRLRAGDGNGPRSFLDRFVTGQFYSDDQPRDDHGRWTDDGGGDSSTSEPGSAREAAQMLADKAHEAEKVTSPRMTRVSELAGGKLLGFGFREKEVDSMSKKISDRMDSRDLTAGQAADTINDSLRYTVGFDDPDIYTDGTRLAMDGLKAQGWTPTGDAKNYWVPGDQYNGINSNWLTDTGQKVEVQFHTQESFDVKFASEELFHQARDAVADGNMDLARQLEAQQTAMWEGVTNPPDVMSIGVPKSASSSR